MRFLHVEIIYLEHASLVIQYATQLSFLMMNWRQIRQGQEERHQSCGMCQLVRP